MDDVDGIEITSTADEIIKTQASAEITAEKLGFGQVMIKKPVDVSRGDIDKQREIQ